MTLIRFLSTRAHHSALAIAVVLGACAPPEAEEIVEQRSAFTSVAPDVRPNIYDFSATQRGTLVNAMLDFITQPILDEHANATDWHHPGIGELFFIRHHDYLNKLEAYLLDHGLTAFLPVPKWDPADPIPNEFMVADPLVPQTQMNQEPNRPLPASVDPDNLCIYRTGSELAGVIEGWHDGVHVAVSGPLARIPTAPGAPIFWLWHGFLDDLYHHWQWDCGVYPAIAATLF